MLFIEYIILYGNLKFIVYLNPMLYVWTIDKYNKI